MKHMNCIKTALLLFLLSLSQLSVAQTGPWAKYDQELKDGALYREASAGNLEEVKSIVAGGGNIHVKMPQTNSTILMAAAGSGKIEVVLYLLEQGADPTAKDWWNLTAVDKARSVGAKDIEQLLTGMIADAAPKQEEKIANPAAPETKQPEEKPEAREAAVQETPKPIPATAKATRTWPVFGTYKVGEPVLYWVPGGWRKGVIKEVGVKNPSGRISVDYSEKKYLIDPEAAALGDEWYAWTGVVSPTRQPFWTSWFVGTWQIGEVTAHHNDIKDGLEKDTYYYMDATESLRVNADRTYSWKLMDGKVKTGKWIPAKDQPGIVLLKAYRDFDWTLRNQTSVDEWRIRKLDIIELQPSVAVGSIKGKRKTTL